MTGEVAQPTNADSAPGPVFHEPTGLPEPERLHLIKRPLVFYFATEDGEHFIQSFTVKSFAEQPPLLKMLMGVGQVGGIEPPEHYEAFLERMVNKGLDKKRRLSPAEIDEVKQTALTDGYASVDQEDSRRLLLTNSGGLYLRTLFPLDDTGSHLPATQEVKIPGKEEVQAESSPDPKRLIKPSEKTLDPKNEADNARIKQLAGLGIRVLDVLAELEVAEGTITTEKNLGFTIARLTRTGITPGDYRKAVRAAVKLGLAERDGERLDLTPEGEAVVADLKSNPAVMKERDEYLLPQGATAKILQSIEDDAIHPDKEGNLWAYPVDNQDPIIRTRAEQLGMTENAYTRRLYEMRADKQYIAIKRLSATDEDTAEVINMRLEPKGTARLRKLQERLAEEFPDMTESISMVEEATEACIRLAGRLGKTELVKMLEATNQDWTILDASTEELNERLETMEFVFDQLRYEHNFWLGSENLEPFDQRDYSKQLAGYKNPAKAS